MAATSGERIELYPRVRRRLAGIAPFLAAGFARKLGAVVNWSGIGNPSGQSAAGAALLLVIGVLGILLIVVLWLELLLRNAAIAVLIAVSPIAAAGQVSDLTKAWWSRTVAATVQLMVLKPVIALVFAVGFGMAGGSSGLAGLLQGLLVLGLAAFAWPVIARFFTFATIQAADSGAGALLGLAAGVAAGRVGGRAGVPPDQLGRDTEARVMGPAASGRAAAGGGGGGGAVAGGVGFALGKLHQAGTMLAGRMEQTAAHGGMHGAYPYSTISGARRIAPPQPAGAAPGAGTPAGSPPAAGSAAGDWGWDDPDAGDGPGAGGHWPGPYGPGGGHDGGGA